VRRAAVLALLVAAVGVATPARAAEVGLNIDPFNAASVPALAGTHTAYARVFLWWPTAEPADGQVDTAFLDHYRATADQLRAQGTKMVVVIVGTPAWASVDGLEGGAPKDPVRFAQFAAQAAQRLGPNVAAYEVWNEPDIDVFWRHPDAIAYTNLLRLAYPAIKRAAPQAQVLFGPLTGGDVDFLQAALAAGARGSFDAVGIHTDIPCELRSPEQYVRDSNGLISRWAFLGYRSVHQVLVRNRADVPLWMTELGWATGDEPCPSGAWAGVKPVGVSEAEQARDLGKAYACLAADPYVKVALWFTLLDDARVMGVMRYGLFREDGNAKPAWDVYRAVAASAPTGSCQPHYVGPHIRLTGKRAVQIRVSAELGLARVTVAVDHQQQRAHVADAPTRWRTVRRLRRGCHTVEVRALDVADNTARARRNVCVR
jgi:hypothetical protein